MLDLKIIIGDKQFELPKQESHEWPKEMFNFLQLVESLQIYCKGELERQRIICILEDPETRNHEFRASFTKIKP